VVVDVLLHDLDPCVVCVLSIHGTGIERQETSKPRQAGLRGVFGTFCARYTEDTPPASPVRAVVVVVAVVVVRMCRSMTQ
jgi:hypothetical protein